MARASIRQNQIEHIEDNTIIHSGNTTTAKSDPKFLSNDTSIPSTDWVSGKIKASLNATDSAPIFACRAWVKFNGSNGTIYGSSGNILSVTYKGAGECEVSFLIPMPDENYACVVSATDSITSRAPTSYPFSYTAKSVTVKTNTETDTYSIVSVVIFR